MRERERERKRAQRPSSVDDKVTRAGEKGSAKNMESRLFLFYILLMLLVHNLNMKKVLYFVILIILLNILNRFILFPHRTAIVSNKIQLLMLYTAIASASVALFTFINNSRPNLIIQVIRIVDKERQIIETVIHYENRSSNPFRDLSMEVRVFDGLEEYNFDYLFSKNMYMAQGDSRNRMFCLKCELDKKKIDWERFGINNSITLKIKYSFSYFNIKNEIAVQKYVFDKQKEIWTIV